MPEKIIYILFLYFVNEKTAGIRLHLPVSRK
jgi:hypothetical protein